MNPLATAEFLISIRQNDKAKIALDLIKPYATTLEQIDAMGKLYAEIREFNECLELAQKVYSLVQTPKQQWDATVNIIRAHLNLNQPLQALELAEKLGEINPLDHPNQMDKAMCYFLLNRKDEGEAILRRILTEPRTDDIDFRVNFNLGTYDLANNNFKEGLRHVLLDGRKLNLWETFNLPKALLWEGGDIAGKTILVCAEGGIGDEIISVRFMKHLKDAGANPIWYTTRKDIAGIFERNGFRTTSSKQLMPGWLWTYSMPVPSYLELEESDLWYGPYITPPTYKWKLSGEKKIGIKCMGNPKYDQDLHRSIPFEQLVDSIPEDYTIYSFHVDEAFLHPRVINLKNKIDNWEDTLGFLNQMDMVVSSCTSLAHATAAMGKPLTVIVPILNYYTWAKKGDKTPWYADNTTILRQQEYDNWDAPLKELKCRLSE